MDGEPLSGPVHRHGERRGRLTRGDAQRLLGRRELCLPLLPRVSERLLVVRGGVEIDLEPTPVVELFEGETMAGLLVARASPRHHRPDPGRLLPQPAQHTGFGE